MLCDFFPGQVLMAMAAVADVGQTQSVGEGAMAAVVAQTEEVQQLPVC